MTILFLDIDGVLIPGRTYFAAYQTKPLPVVFDPCVVGMVNRICKELDAKIVIHSNWRRSDPRRIARGYDRLSAHFIDQGILAKYLHEDDQCPMKLSSSRWHDISTWLDDHPEVKDDYWVIEDEPMPRGYLLREERVVQTNFDEGLTVQQTQDILGQRFLTLGEY